MKFRKSSCLGITERWRILLWKSSCLPNLSFPSSALLRPSHWAHLERTKIKRKEEHTYYSSCHLHCVIFSTEMRIKLMYLEKLILHFVSDWTQHHKGKCSCCNALLNESYHTHSRLLTINSEQDLIWVKRLQAQLHSGFVLGFFPYSGRYRIGWTAGSFSPLWISLPLPWVQSIKIKKKGTCREWGMEQKYSICH